MADQHENLSFLPFFLNEAVYIIPEKLPVAVTEPDHKNTSNSPDMTDPQIQSADHEPASEPQNQEEGLITIPDTIGENRKGILVLFYQQEASDLEPSSLALLEKILKAIGLHLQDIARCNWASLEPKLAHQGNIYESLQLIECQKMIVFGDLPLAWSMSHFFRQYSITKDAEGRQLLLADDLAVIGKDQNLKRKLWESLQKMFD